MAEKKGLEKYQTALVDWISSSVHLDHGKGFVARDDAERELLDTVFRRFAELTESVERLDLCLSFIKAPMPRRKGLKADHYLMYHITFYLQEMYVLEERFRAYAKSVLRLRTKRLGEHHHYKENLERVLAFIRETLAPVAAARGGHVHARAFRDEDMKDLSMYSFLAMLDSKNPEWRSIAKHLYSASREKWVRQVSNSREAIDDILNLYGELMYAIVFSGSPSLLPNNSSKPTPLRGAA